MCNAVHFPFIYKFCSHIKNSRIERKIKNLIGLIGKIKFNFRPKAKCAQGNMKTPDIRAKSLPSSVRCSQMDGILNVENIYKTTITGNCGFIVGSND